MFQFFSLLNDIDIDNDIDIYMDINKLILVFIMVLIHRCSYIDLDIDTDSAQSIMRTHLETEQISAKHPDSS